VAKRGYYGDEMSLEMAAAALGKSRKTLLRWHCQGYGPARTSTCKRRVQYSKREVEAWKGGQELRRKPGPDHAVSCNWGHEAPSASGEQESC
jgi:predicted DNA-binding transcriptional regulator AlpA